MGARVMCVCVCARKREREREKVGSLGVLACSFSLHEIGV